MHRVGIATVALVAIVGFLLGAIAASWYDVIRFPALTQVSSVSAPSSPPKPDAKPKAPVPVPVLAEGELRSALRRGGYVIFVRHATRNDTKTVAPFDAALLGKQPLQHPELKSGVCLNAEGEAEAWLIGEAVRELAIPIGRVLASPTCRTQQTGRIALGRVDDISPHLGYLLMFREDERKRWREEFLRLLNTPPASGTNTFLVSHGNLLEHVGLPIQLEQAEAAVFEPQVGANAKFIARISPLTWVHLLERAPALAK